MNDGGRLLSDAAVHQEANSDKDKRNTETLSHIKDHIVLETHLRLLDELDKEAHSEATYEEGSDKESSMKLRQSIFVHQDLEHTQKEVAESLIKLGRMLWFRLVSKLENEAPRKRSNVSVDL